jgi:hypothetical protein
VKLHLVFLWLFVLLLGGASVMPCGPPFLLAFTPHGGKWLPCELPAVVSMTVEIMPTLEKGLFEKLSCGGDLLFLRNHSQLHGAGERCHRLHCYLRFPSDTARRSRTGSSPAA